jgi:hypothetical protein
MTIDGTARGTGCRRPNGDSTAICIARDDFCAIVHACAVRNDAACLHRGIPAFH